MQFSETLEYANRFLNSPWFYDSRVLWNKDHKINQRNLWKISIEQYTDMYLSPFCNLVSNPKVHDL